VVIVPSINQIDNTFDRILFALRSLLLSRHARRLSPYPPQSSGGALGVSGIQMTFAKRVIPALDSRLAVPRPHRGLAARMSENVRE